MDEMFAFYLRTFEKKENEAPLFILGSGRNGSTLLASILNCHDGVFIPKENRLILRIMKYWHFHSLSTWKNKVLQILKFTQNEYDWKLDLAKLSEFLLSQEIKHRSLDTIIKSIFHFTAIKYGKSKVIWGDQTPGNAIYIKSIKAQFPSCKIILLLRDPRDVLNSYQKLEGREISEKFVLWRWKNSIYKYESLKRMYPEDTKMVKYEEMVTNWETKIRCLFDWIGLDFDSTDFTRRKDLATKLFGAYEKTLHHRNVWNEINSLSVGKWKTELDKPKAKKVEYILSQEMNKYGYAF